MDWSLRHRPPTPDPPGVCTLKRLVSTYTINMPGLLDSEILTSVELVANAVGPVCALGPGSVDVVRVSCGAGFVDLSCKTHNV